MIALELGHLPAAGIAWVCTLGFVRSIVPERSTRWMDAAAVLAGLMSALFVIGGLAGLSG